MADTAVKTEKLYYEDLYASEFDAEVLRQEIRQGQNAVVLDRTLFYPVGGGQLSDTGTLNGVRVEKVYEEDGEIFHIVDAEIDGDTVHGVIDWERRFELMQLHLGQHILSAVFVRDFGLDTVDLRMEENIAYIDVNGAVDDEGAKKAEETSNEVIWEDIPVEVLYPDMDEIKKNSKRPVPETDEEIRIVKIGDLDYIPCCGLQNARTGEVGLIKVLRTERRGSGSRIYFLCGRKAFGKMRSMYDSMVMLRDELGCSEDQFDAKVLKLRDEVDDLKERESSLIARVSRAEASSLLSSAEKIGDISIVSSVIPGSSQNEVKALFEQLTAEPGVAALLIGETPKGAFLLFGCNKSEKRVNVKDAFVAAIETVGGRGGGKPFYSQGFGPDVDAAEDAMAKACEILRSSLA